VVTRLDSVEHLGCYDEWIDLAPSQQHRRSVLADQPAIAVDYPVVLQPIPTRSQDHIAFGVSLDGHTFS